MIIARRAQRSGGRVFAALEQVVLHAGLGHVLVDLHRLGVLAQLCAELSDLELALVGVAGGRLGGEQVRGLRKRRLIVCISNRDI